VNRRYLHIAGLILMAGAGGGPALSQVPAQVPAEVRMAAPAAVVPDTLAAGRRVAAPAAVVPDTLAAGRRVAPRDSARVRTVKNPTAAMLRSLALPGWGQWYNEKKFKAVVMMGAELGLVADAIVQNQLAARSEQFYEREYYRNNRSLAIWWLGAVILYSMADAYVDAHLFGFDERPELTLGLAGAPAGAGPAPVVSLGLAVNF